jgi:hypothetical protein
VSSSIVDRINYIDAVVVAEISQRTGFARGEGHGATALRALYDASVRDVVYQFEEKATPRLQGGDSITVSDANEFGTYKLDAAKGTEVVLFLAYYAPDDRWPEVGNTWYPGVVARTTDEGLEFYGSASRSGHYGEEIASLRRYLAVSDLSAAAEFKRDSAGELALLTDWVREFREGPAYDGPISQAFLSPERSTFDQSIAWYALPPELRPLDLELSPEAALQGLTEVPVIIDIEADARTPGVYLVARTSRGVSHVAELSAGPHPASIFTAEGDAWEFVLTDDLATLLGPVVAEVSPEDRSAGLHAVVRVRAALIDEFFAATPGASTLTASYPVVTFLSSEDVQRLLDGFVEGDAGG